MFNVILREGLCYVQWKICIFCVEQIVEFENSNRQDSLAIIRTIIRKIWSFGGTLKVYGIEGLVEGALNLEAEGEGLCLTFISCSLSDLRNSKEIIK